MDPEESEVRQLFLKFSQKLVDLIGSRCGVDHTSVSVGLRIHDLGDLQKQILGYSDPDLALRMRSPGMHRKQS